MRTFVGVAASPGTAVAQAYVYQPDVYDLPTVATDTPDRSYARMSDALDEVAASLAAAADTTTGASSEILRAQAAMARDPALRQSARTLVDAGAHPARAVVAAGEQFARTFERSGNEYLAARAPDVRHICDLAARGIVGAPARVPPRPDRPCVLIADDLMPADAAVLDSKLVHGIVTAQGTPTSHTSVIARALGVPAVVGVRGVVDSVARDEQIGIDGCTGEIVVQPDPSTVRRLASLGDAYRQDKYRGCGKLWKRGW
jgi:phosphotransferase system enzyme I (PtsI)